MTFEDFSKLTKARFDYCYQLLTGVKQDKYTRDNDRLQHFKVTGRIKNETPERALWGMWSKQIASLLDVIEDLERNPLILPSEEILNELISDNSNYPVLLEGLLRERKVDIPMNPPRHKVEK